MFSSFMFCFFISFSVLDSLPAWHYHYFFHASTLIKRNFYRKYKLTGLQSYGTCGGGVDYVHIYQ